jgi:GTP:adenosylcobinamide-phosphate guanylyltransferase
MTHTHSPQTTNFGMTLYVCTCGARKQKSKIVNGVKVEVWAMESKSEEAARNHAIEMLETEGYGYGKDANDLLDSHDPRNQD